MKTFFQYLHFFFYTTWHWNIGLAFFLLYHDIRGALRYDTRRTFAPVPLNRLTITGGDPAHSSPYEAVNYYMLEKLLLAFRRLSPQSSLVDLGCGKGRVMVVAAHLGFSRITGIDFARELCEEATRNMKAVQQDFPEMNWEVIHANVLGYAIRPQDSVFFMFNPFSEDTLHRFLDGLELSCREYPRKTWFLYAAPVHATALERRGYSVLYRHTLMNLKGMIFCKE